MLENAAIWADLVGDAWVRHADVIDAHNEDFGDAVLAAIGPVEGASVLDVGCGNGASSLELARRGARRVLGVDLSTPMVANARARADAGGLSSTVAFEVADVRHIDEPGAFDVVHSRDGVMFLEDAVAGFAHLRRLARPEGGLGFTAWAEREGNPWMIMPMLASIPVLGPPELPGPGEPGPFSLATPDRIEQVLIAAGWHDLAIEELSFERPHAAGDAETFAAVIVEINPLLAAGLARSPERADDLRAAIADAVRPLEVDGAVVVRATAHIMTAAA